MIHHHCHGRNAHQLHFYSQCAVLMHLLQVIIPAYMLRIEENLWDGVSPA